jgi:pilus assembly protein TadC
VTEELAIRLERVHAPVDVTGFRVRQAGFGVIGFLVGGLLALALRLPPILGLLFVAGGPLLAFMAGEQRLANASAAWQRRLLLELPVVAEQLAMLLAAGYSLGTALNRVAARGNGACARDLTRLSARMRQGVSDVAALREWAAVARVSAVDQLVAVLALNHETSDLGRLVSEEARSIRRDVHRQLLETVDRRNQQVWVPVTVATLVPGVIFMAIPFIEALRVFSGT